MTRTCSDCGKPISRHSGSGLCRNCRYNDLDGSRTEIARLRQEGESYTRIAARLGLTKQAVAVAVRRMAPSPPPEEVARCAGTIEWLDAVSRRRALTNEESLKLERAIITERRFLRSKRGAPVIKRLWTDAEDKLILSDAVDAESRRVVAEKIGRSAAAVMQRRSFLLRSQNLAA